MHVPSAHRPTKSTYQSHTPDKAIVESQPALLRKANRGLSSQAGAASQWLEDPFNHNCADCGESQGAADDEVDIIPTLNVRIRCGVVVGKLEERLGVGTEGRVEVMKSQQRSQDGQ